MNDPICKQFAATLTIGDAEHTVLARISTAGVDRDGEVLVPQGCDATDFNKSPTVFYNHDYTLPVERCEGIRRYEDTIEAKTRFAQRPENHQGPWLPDSVFALLQQGVINGFSVGFVPVEGRHPSKKDQQQFGSKVRYVYSKWKLLEYSIAPLPANQDALVLAASKGIVTANAARQLFPDLTLAPVRAKRRVLIVVDAPPQQVVDVDACVRRAVLKSQGALYA
jgi:HK97 family phage prohead protease